MASLRGRCAPCSCNTASAVQQPTQCWSFAAAPQRRRWPWHLLPVAWVALLPYCPATPQLPEASQSNCCASQYSLSQTHHHDEMICTAYSCRRHIELCTHGGRQLGTAGADGRRGGGHHGLAHGGARFLNHAPPGCFLRCCDGRGGSEAGPNGLERPELGRAASGGGGQPPPDVTSHCLHSSRRRTGRCARVVGVVRAFLAAWCRGRAIRHA